MIDCSHYNTISENKPGSLECSHGEIGSCSRLLCIEVDFLVTLIFLFSFLRRPFPPYFLNQPPSLISSHIFFLPSSPSLFSSLPFSQLFLGLFLLHLPSLFSVSVSLSLPFSLPLSFSLFFLTKFIDWLVDCWATQSSAQGSLHSWHSTQKSPLAG